MKAAKSKSTALVQRASQKAQNPFFKKGGDTDFFSKQNNSIQKQVDTFQNSQPFFTTNTGIQTKLTIGQPNDKYEKEADQMADQVIQRMAKPEIISSPVEKTISPYSMVQHKCTDCEKKEKLQKKESEGEMELSEGIEIQRKPVFENNDGKSKPSIIQKKCSMCGKDEDFLQRKSGSNGEEFASDDLQSRLSQSKGSGSPMSSNTKSSMESSFGADFSNVRIHTNSQAVQMSNDLGAQAFTHGSDIYFNSGKYDTKSNEGKHLLAHELTHTVQQGGSEISSKIIQKSSSKVQHALREANKGKLVTEAPIPGAAPTSMTKRKGFDVVGYADLYKDDANPTSKIGIRGLTIDKLDNGNLKYVYSNFNTHRTKGDKKSIPKMNKPYARFETTTSGALVRDITKAKLKDNFPSKISLGEIKSINPSVEDAMFAGKQLTAYKEGLQDFVRNYVRVHFNDNTIKVPDVVPFTDLDIPDGMDYDQFQTQKTKKKAPGLRTTRIGRYNLRYWLAREGDVYLYALLPHPWNEAEFSAHASKVTTAMKDLRKNVLVEFNQRQGTPDINLKRKYDKTNINTRNSESKNSNEKANSKNGINSKQQATAKTNARIQRKETDWKKEEKDFIDARDSWKKRHYKNIVGNKKIKKSNKYAERKEKFDKKLGKPKSTASNVHKLVKGFKKVEFWGGFKGLALGKLRFALGEKFDWLALKFQKLKDKSNKVIGKSNGLSNAGFSVGWKKKIIKLLLKGFKFGFQSFIAAGYQIFAACVGGMIDKFKKSFSEMDEVQEQQKKFEALQANVVKLTKDLEVKYGSKIDEYEAVIEKMKDTAYYAELLGDAITLIRLGVQALSCVSPPALGCLWGLVAQVGIETGLNLVAGTQWFEDEFMKPMVKRLMDDFLKDDILKVINLILTEAGLGTYIKGIKACEPGPEVKSKFTSGGWYKTPSDKKIIPNDDLAHRQKWEKKNQAEILSDLEKVFEGKKGKKVSQKELEDLVKELQKLNKPAAEMKKLLEGARNPISGKLNAQKASENIKRGELPKEKPKSRKIDYEKAHRSNLIYQNSLIKWVPFLFVKDPEIKTDSKEFADAIYDFQKAIGTTADGMAGPSTTMKFYEKNKLPKDQVYKNAESNSKRKSKGAKPSKGGEKKPSETKPKVIELMAADVKIPSTENTKAHRKGRLVYKKIISHDLKTLVFDRSTIKKITIELYYNSEVYRIIDVDVANISFFEWARGYYKESDFPLPSSVDLSFYLKDGIEIEMGGEIIRILGFNKSLSKHAYEDKDGNDFWTDGDILFKEG